MNHRSGPEDGGAPLLSVIATSHTLDRLGDVFDLIDRLAAQDSAGICAAQRCVLSASFW